MTIFTATPETLDGLWEFARPHLERFAAETLLISPEDILQQVREGEKQLWMVSEDGEVLGVVVTEVYETLKGRICCIYAACGSVGVPSLLPTFTEIESWAIGIDCVALEVRGRKGWKRVLPDFQEAGVLLEKCLKRMH